MKLNLIEFPGKMFTRVGEILVAEASDLGNRHLQRLYDDATDVGLAIRSERTNRVVIFSMTKACYHTDGELLGWDYTPTWESMKAVPECTNLQLHVIND